jgi:hypothetical protein
MTMLPLLSTRTRDPASALPTGEPLCSHVMVGVGAASGEHAIVTVPASAPMVTSRMGSFLKDGVNPAMWSRKIII